MVKHLIFTKYTGKTKTQIYNQIIIQNIVHTCHSMIPIIFASTAFSFYKVSQSAYGKNNLYICPAILAYSEQNYFSNEEPKQYVLQSIENAYNKVINSSHRYITDPTSEQCFP